MVRLPVVAVDVGNARIKLGLFCDEHGPQLPAPTTTLTLDGRQPEWGRIAAWLAESARPHTDWWIASVNRPAARRLLDLVRDHRPADPVTLLSAGDLPLVVDVARPDAVGIDRLLDAVAANHLRRPGRPAVVVDAGTAVTVDLISAEGAFRGGAILPGMTMAAHAMHDLTDLLPLIDPSEMATPPPALGTDTEAALRSGLFWGTLGAIDQLIGRLAAGAEPQVFLTGGAGAALVAPLGRAAQHVPHLTLSGIALTADKRSKGPRQNLTDAR